MAKFTPPLWMTLKAKGNRVIFSLAKCRNCGQVKISSDPCGFDHLAAIGEFFDTYPELRDIDPNVVMDRLAAMSDD